MPESENLAAQKVYSHGRSHKLQGKRVLVTRTREQAGALSERLQALGALPVEFPAIRIEPPQDWEPLDTALGKLFLADARNQPYYSWLIFTSANGVNVFCERLISRDFHAQMMAGVRVAAIGPATAAALARYGITADLVPGAYIAESVAAALIEDARKREESLEGKRILLPRAAETRKVLVTALQQAGAIVDEVAAYHTLPVASNEEQGRAVLRLLQTGQLDIITFTSSSTVRNFMQWLTSCVSDENVVEPCLEDRHTLAGTLTLSGGQVIGGQVTRQVIARNPQLKIACIGPITSQAARELGLYVAIEAKEFTIDGLVEAIIQSEDSGFSIVQAEE